MNNVDQRVTLINQLVSIIVPLLSTLGILTTDQSNALVAAIIAITGAIITIGSIATALLRRTHASQGNAAGRSVTAQTTPKLALGIAGPVISALRGQGFQVNVTPRATMPQTTL